MTDPLIPRFLETDLDAIAGREGHLAVLVPEAGTLSPAARRINRLSKGALARLVGSDAFARLKPGEAVTLSWPAGLAAEAVQVVRLERRLDRDAARRAGGAIAAAAGDKAVTVLAGAQKGLDELVLGAVLRAYAFDTYKTGKDAPRRPESLSFMVNDLAATEGLAERIGAQAQGVFFARDLVNEPANVLTTGEFAARLEALADLGVKVTVLEEAQLERLGMRCLLAVGQGSQSPSKVVVMHWQGAGDDRAPLALVGKGVVFDTGGISIKPSAGMEDMTMDMGGAATVAGTIRALALRKARANVVGIVGLVENMPDGRAQRPGDVVRSMKGEMVEVINTDAEGRLVLADILWHVQQEYDPAAVIDLATLTGAIIVALGHENTGVFANDDALARQFLRAAAACGEGAWRMPLGPGYAKKLKSRVADMRNSTGREAGAVTAAEFLHRFIREGTPWLHLDIAGTALVKEDLPLSPKGATGWGVRALDRLVADRFEVSDEAADEAAG